MSLISFLVSFLVSYFNLAPSSRSRHLSIRSSFVDVSGLVSGLVFEPGSELPFGILVDQIEVLGCLWSFLVSFSNLAPRAHLRCLSRKSSFVDVSGLVSEPGSEGSFAMPVE